MRKAVLVYRRVLRSEGQQRVKARQCSASRREFNVVSVWGSVLKSEQVSCLLEEGSRSAESPGAVRRQQVYNPNSRYRQDVVGAAYLPMPCRVRRNCYRCSRIPFASRQPRARW